MSAPPKSLRGRAAIPDVGRLFRAGTYVAWIGPFLVLSLLTALAFVPAFLTAKAVADFGFGRHPAVQAFLLGLSIPVGYLVFTVALLLVLPASRWLLGIRSKVGDTPMRSLALAPWYHQLATTYLFRALCGRFVQATGLYHLFARLMGAKVGRNVVLNSTNLYDLDLHRYGDGALVGGDAYLIGHVVERGVLHRAPITLGAGASVGLGAVVLPGATLGANCHVGAMSLVPKGATLDANAIYAGNPVRKVRDL
ncbi:MAG: hypothetical protein AABX89_04625 [Candidatus Thermoplasmatota archaeon]